MEPVFYCDFRVSFLFYSHVLQSLERKCQWENVPYCTDDKNFQIIFYISLLLTGNDLFLVLG